MSELQKTIDYTLATTSEEETDSFPLALRIFAVLSILGGGLQVAAFVQALLLIIFGRADLAAESNQTVTLVVGIVAEVASGVLAALFIMLGIRLLRGKRQSTALVANVMIAVETVVLVCHFLISGVGPELITPAINVGILVALQTYADPSLRGERKLQRHLHELEIKTQAEEGTLGRDTTGKGYITLNFYNIFWVFVICSVLGLLIELAWHMTVVAPGEYQDRAGLLYGPFSPIYGVGAVLMTTALNRFHNSNPLIIFVVSAVIGGAFEFFVSWFLQNSFGITAWDYTGTFLSIDGRTNGMYMAMWGILGLVWVKLCLPLMLKAVNAIPWNWRYAATGICTAMLLVDIVLTLSSLDCWYQRESGMMDYRNQSAIVKFCNEHYTNAFMESRFQTMDIDPSNAARVK